MKRSETAIVIMAVMITGMVMGCVEPEYGRSDSYVYEVHTPRIPAATPTEIMPMYPKASIMVERSSIEIVIDTYIGDREYVIYPKNRSDVYVCSHYGCNMAQALIDDGYNAGVIHDNTENHILTWINLNGTRYAIEPQTGEYWLSDEYKLTHNIDYVSLSKGKEFVKSSSEGLHR